MFPLQRIALQGILLLVFCFIILANPVEKTSRQRWIQQEQERLLVEHQLKNLSRECYRSRRECDSKCTVSCEESDDCDGIRGTWYRCSSNYWLIAILMVVLALFLVVLLVACQCVDKGQGCDNVDLYPRILGNHRRSQTRGINTVQYFTAVRAGRRTEQHRKASVISHNGFFNHHRASVTSQTPLAPPQSNYRYL